MVLEDHLDLTVKRMLFLRAQCMQIATGIFHFPHPYIHKAR